MKSNANYIQVFEHQTLRVDGQVFLQEHLEALSYFNTQQGQKYFTLVHQGVKFKQYVGVLQVGALTLEILPKTDQYNQNKQQWQKVLLDLLHQCNFINIEALSEAPLAIKKSPIFWIYIQLFVVEIEQLLQKGLLKNYQRQEHNASSWKGQVNFAKQLQKNLSHPQRICTKEQVYDYQHPLHQVLYKALQIVREFWVSPSLQNRIDYLCKVFPTQKDITVHLDWFENLNLKGKKASYQKAIDLAKMLVLQYSPDVRVGRFPVLAILFDMNLLFEQYVYQQLQKKANQNCKIQAQANKVFWSNRTLRPDILIETATQNYIIDTKWKILQKPSPSDQDLRQMYAYNLNFESTKSLLVYPNVFGLKNKIAPFAVPLSLEGKEQLHYCQIVFVDILDEQGNLNKKIGEEILGLCTLI